MIPVSPYLAETCRLYILGVLVVSAAGKALALRDFRQTLVDLAGVPASWTRAAALGIVAVEALIALALLAGEAWAGMAMALILFLGFAGVILAALVRRRAVRCNCFGFGGRLISAYDLVRNGLMIAACATYLIRPPAPGAIAVGAYPLLAAVAAALFLASVRLDDIVGLLRRAAGRRGPGFTVPIGQAIPDFEGRGGPDGRRVSASVDLAGQAAVLVFLSSACPKCGEKLPELRRILPAAREAGVALWIVPMEAARSPLPEGSPLAEHLLVLETPARRRLNPRNAAPFYIFLDHQRIARASNFIGDPDWLSFLDQMDEISDGGRTRPRAADAR